MTQDKINRINELAHKENLTDEEKAEQAAQGRVPQERYQQSEKSA